MTPMVARRPLTGSFTMPAYAGSRVIHAEVPRVEISPIDIHSQIIRFTRLRNQLAERQLQHTRFGRYDPETDKALDSAWRSIVTLNKMGHRQARV